MVLNDLITPYFTHSLTPHQSVYDLFQWHTVDTILKDHQTGQVLVHMKDLAFPTHFSQTACDIIATKYFRKKHETSFRQVVHRMVTFWVKALLDEKLITPDVESTVYNELAYMMLAQMWAPNSPQWFNTGLHLAYGLTGSPQGHFYFDEEKQEVVPSPDAYTRTQGSACFIVSVTDTLLGDHSLTDLLTTETRLFKYGSGVGTNWSSIRGEGEPLSGGGKSSGLMSFLKVFDRNAGAIKSGGTTRRAAKMNVLDINHPEAPAFIQWKAHEEDKVVALGKMGYDTHFDGEAYETVSGQNANNSIRVSDAFMKDIFNPDATFDFINRMDDAVAYTLPTEKLFQDIAFAAWRCGDPGIQFDDTINSWHTCPFGEDGDTTFDHNRIHASNPCSEYMFLDDTACNLASINILKFYDVSSKAFDLEGYLHCIKLVQLVLESTIHQGQFPTSEIARKSYHFRTTGLGLTNLGALLMLLGLPYDSEEARTIAATLMSLLTGYSYFTSSLMAKVLSPFTYFALNKPAMLRVLRNHARAAKALSDNFEALSYAPETINHSLLKTLDFTELSDALLQVWKDVLHYGETYGFRNAQVSVLAPTGTIAFAMDCATTSCEPFFSHVVYKKLVGGGVLELINPLLPDALANLGYTSSEIDSIVSYVLRKDPRTQFLLDGKLEGAPYLKESHYAIFDTANTCGTGKRYISPNGHVKMMAALTPHVSGAISKTVNLPQDATTDDVQNIYHKAWQSGVKAIALYRDGCKTSQPLNTSLNTTASADLHTLSYDALLAYATEISTHCIPTRKKPIGIRHAHVHEAEIGGLKLYLTVSFYENGKIGELYVSAGRQGSLVKGLLDSISTTVSEMLQYGVEPQNISRMYRGQKFEPSGFVSGHPYIKMADSISDLISKIIDIELGDYTYCQVKPEGATPATPLVPASPLTAVTSYDYEVCSVCKSNKLVKNGTCKVCTQCGTTTGCS
ncbi:MAG: vitamin B12-dependent ribonucleotide reductase [Cellulosilyticaceae bacterium]